MLKLNQVMYDPNLPFDQAAHSERVPLATLSSSLSGHSHVGHTITSQMDGTQMLSCFSLTEKLFAHA